MMTETLAGMSSLKKTAQKFTSPTEVEQATIQQLVKAARERGEDLTGPGGLLKQLTKTVLETALDEEMNEHLATTNTPRRAVTAVIHETVAGPRRC